MFCKCPESDLCKFLIITLHVPHDCVTTNTSSVVMIVNSDKSLNCVANDVISFITNVACVTLCFQEKWTNYVVYA